MTKKKIIPCLDVKDGRVVKGVNFVDLEDIGKPKDLADQYNQNGADELVFLDISKTVEGHDLLLDLIRETSKDLTIPLTIGGGIQSVEDIEKLFEAGADKVSINSAAVANPAFVTEASQKFGSDKIVVAIDTEYDDKEDKYYVLTHGGKKRADVDALEWVKECEKLGAGELLITSMDHDGVKEGFDYDFLSKSAEAVSIPVTASGGAGSIQDFIDVFNKTNVSAGLAASIFHKGIVQIPELKAALKKEGIEVEG